MPNQSFVTATTGEGFNRYTDIVKELLQIHKGIKDAYFTNASTTPYVDAKAAFEVIANLTLTTQSAPTGYNIDENGETQAELLKDFKTLRDKFTSTYAQTTSDALIRSQVSKLQKHLKALIDNSSNNLYSSVNDYYNQNLRESRRIAIGGVNNLLNGGYWFTSDWNRLSAAVGVTYSTDYDKA